MKLNGKILVTVAMMLGSMAAITGCKSSEKSAEPDSTPTEQSAPAAEPAPTETAKATDERTTIQASASVGVKTTSRHAPPPPPERYENPGRAPSRDHTWLKGYWRWDTGSVRYVWEPGRWMVQFAPSAPPAQRYEDRGRPPSERHVWIQGHWQRSGREWVWVAGRWEARRDRQEYAGPRWERRHGRWEYVPGHWVRR